MSFTTEDAREYVARTRAAVIAAEQALNDAIRRRDRAEHHDEDRAAVDAEREPAPRPDPVPRPGLEELPDEDQVEILEHLDSERAADVLEEMSADDAADLIADLDRALALV